MWGHQTQPRVRYCTQVVGSLSILPVLDFEKAHSQNLSTLSSGYLASQQEKSIDKASWEKLKDYPAVKSTSGQIRPVPEEWSHCCLSDDPFFCF